MCTLLCAGHNQVQTPGLHKRETQQSSNITELQKRMVVCKAACCIDNNSTGKAKAGLCVSKWKLQQWQHLCCSTRIVTCLSKSKTSERFRAFAVKGMHTTSVVHTKGQQKVKPVHQSLDSQLGDWEAVGDCTCLHLIMTFRLCSLLLCTFSSLL